MMTKRNQSLSSSLFLASIFSVCFFFSSQAVASYSKNISGFYLKHFALMKDLKDTSCKPFLNRVYRGGQPVFDGSDTWLKKIKSSQIKTVFDLRSETKNAAIERDTLLKNGIGYVKLPLTTGGTIPSEYFDVEVAIPGNFANGKQVSSHIITKTRMTSTEATIYVLEMMEEKISLQGTDGIYLHCQRGEDRTGMMVALLRDCTGTGWKTEFNSYGGVMYKPLQYLFTEVSKMR
ncbi:MAG: hypothetical protein HOP07_14500 [Bacteriovoracaceae bacterium]|nr:hypothetical protein [Bacteriovoracaceae bacterium]